MPLSKRRFTSSAPRGRKHGVVLFSMSAAEPSRLRRLFRSRWVRGILIAVAVLYGPYRFNEWAWERKWQRYVAESRARGVNLYSGEFISKEPIADGDNFASTPIWREVFAPGYGTGPFPSKFYVVQQAAKKFGSSEPLARPARFDLARWRAGMVDAKKLTAADAALSDGAAILRGLEFLKPELDEIRASVKRPKVRFPVKWEDGFAVRLPHYATMQGLSRMLQLSTVAKLAEGDADGAFEDWGTLRALAGKIENEPSLIGALVHAAMMRGTFDTAREGIEMHRWTPGQLEAIQHLLADTNLIQSHVLALSGERALFNTGIEPSIGKSEAITAMTAGSTAGMGGIGEIMIGLRARTRSWWRENQLWANRHFDEELTMWDADAEVMRPHTRQFDPDAIAGFLATIDLYLALLALPVYDHAGKNALHAHATLRMAGLACALERFRMANGRYPERLGELVPQFMGTLPHDPCDGQPFRYRVTPEGYLLYSIGTDLKDDGGKMDDARDMGKGPDWRWWSPEGSGE